MNSPASSIIDFPTSFIENDFNIFSVDGSKIKNKQDLLREFSEKLNFPSYFGFNWDGFNDCLTDLSWLESKGIVIIYKVSHDFMERNPEDWKIATRILLEAIEFWRSQNRMMIVMFI
jgi:RNAse (barnase) inhibitor barstar